MGARSAVRSSRRKTRMTFTFTYTGNITPQGWSVQPLIRRPAARLGRRAERARGVGTSAVATVRSARRRIRTQHAEAARGLGATAARAHAIRICGIAAAAAHPKIDAPAFTGKARRGARALRAAIRIFQARLAALAAAGAAAKAVLARGLVQISVPNPAFCRCAPRARGMLQIT